MRCIVCVHSLYKLTATTNNNDTAAAIATTSVHAIIANSNKTRTVQNVVEKKKLPGSKQRISIFVAYPFKLVRYMCTHSSVEQSGMNGEYLFVVNIFYVFDVVVNFFSFRSFLVGRSSACSASMLQYFMK